jgi:multidrug efflux system membrane fusion protein
MDSRHLPHVALYVALGIAAAGGCRDSATQEGATERQVVTVSLPVVRDVRDYADFTGTTDAVESVDVRARVSGYLDKISFQEGFEVKEGALLFNIDPRPFKAQYDEAAAQVKVRLANLEDQRAELARAKALLEKSAIAQADFDKTAAQYGEAVASAAAAEAQAAAMKLNLDFATIFSPIGGRISRANITVGNLVKADDTLLTTVVSQDPMYVYFDVDEHTMLRVTRALFAAKENLLHSKKVPLLMGLADEEGFPHAGTVNFADNVVDASTATVRARGVFANPAGPSGIRLLRPGMFVRVRLPLGEARRAVLVAERALGTDQGKKYLLVVDLQQQVEYRPVTVGPVQDDGLRVIAEGLGADERVIVSGLQLVRPKMEVDVEEKPMIRPAGEGAAPPPPAAAPPGAGKPAAAPAGTPFPAGDGPDAPGIHRR